MQNYSKVFKADLLAYMFLVWKAVNRKHNLQDYLSPNLSTNLKEIFLPTNFANVRGQAIVEILAAPWKGEICCLARALRIYFPEKPVNPALIRITACNQTSCECIVCVLNPSLMMGLCKASEEAKLARHSPNKQVCRPLRSPCTNVDYRQVALECPTLCLPAPQFKADVFLCPQEKFS